MMETMENLAARLYPTLETLLLPWLYLFETATHSLLPAAQKICALKAEHSLASKPQGLRMVATVYCAKRSAFISIYIAKLCVDVLSSSSLARMMRAELEEARGNCLFERGMNDRLDSKWQRDRRAKGRRGAQRDLGIPTQKRQG